jgi:hypothetical protein
MISEWTTSVEDIPQFVRPNRAIETDALSAPVPLTRAAHRGR